MRILAATTAAAAAAALAPAAGALPVQDTPLTSACSFGSTVNPLRPEAPYYHVVGAPVVPVSTTGAVIADVATTCSYEIVPATFPARTLVTSSQDVGGVAVLLPVVEPVPVDYPLTTTWCVRATWTDGGAPRSFSRCRTDEWTGAAAD